MTCPIPKPLDLGLFDRMCGIKLIQGFLGFLGIKYSEVVYYVLILGLPWNYAPYLRLQRLPLLLVGTVGNKTPDFKLSSPSTQLKELTRHLQTLPASDLVTFVSYQY